MSQDRDGEVIRQNILLDDEDKPAADSNAATKRPTLITVGHIKALSSELATQGETMVGVLQGDFEPRIFKADRCIGNLVRYIYVLLRLM